MRQLIIQVPRGNGKAVIDIAKSHNGSNLGRFEGNADEPIAVFGYVTATLATFFIGRDADDDEAELAGAKSIQLLQSEIATLREEIQQLLHQNSQR
ncbi:hypothetical protein DSM107003_25820 [Trichormus variabilis SAG 1403-4b]|uniref:Uncharacterized protein n=1 Tax=Trichormus variabilis SAG 1403-4b TaxID=447716 RepID=A0A3S1AA60_ANAVA|nr:hypothetical protein DSM107003_25820 [Trichormus variabilis SAG 1403-4b]